MGGSKEEKEFRRVTEFQKVNNFQVGFEFNHVIHHPYSKLSKSNKWAIIFDIFDILPYTNLDMKD